LNSKNLQPKDSRELRRHQPKPNVEAETIPSIAASGAPPHDQELVQMHLLLLISAMIDINLHKVKLEDTLYLSTSVKIRINQDKIQRQSAHSTS